MSLDPDDELVRRAKAGDYAAFEQLVGKYQGTLYSLALRIVRQPEEAQDIVQQTFLSLVEHLAEFRAESQFSTWLSRIATNQALKWVRKKKEWVTGSLEQAASKSSCDDDYATVPHPEYIAKWRDNPARLAEERETRQLLEEALDALDDKYRLVFLLRDVQGFSTHETAESLGISQANVKVRLLRARLMLRERLTRAWGDDTTRVTPQHDHD